MKNAFSLRKVGGFILTAILLSGIAMFSADTAQAQRRGHGRVVIVRPYRFYNPWYYRRYDPWRYDSFRYNQYVFENGEKAADSGYKQGFKTGRDDGKKSKSYSPERSHYFHDAGFGNYSEAYRSGFSRGYSEGYRAGNSGLGN